MMERRTFLKGALIAASKPAVALAPAAVTTIRSLISEHAEIDELYRLSDEREGNISKDPSKPAWPHIMAKEFGPYRSGMYTDDKAFLTEESIIALFGRERNYVDLWRHCLSEDQCAAIVADADRRQANALELLSLRKARYDQWRRDSGYEAAADETARLAKLLGHVEDKILSYRCETIDDVRQKAEFFDRMWGEAAPEGFVEAFVKSLIA